MGHLIALGAHAYLLEHLFDTSSTLSLVAPSGCFEYKVEIVSDVAIGKQLEVLEDDTNALAQSGYMLTAYMGHVVAQYLGIAAMYIEFANKR